jgi:hypothetical protein
MKKHSLVLLVSVLGLVLSKDAFADITQGYLAGYVTFLNSNGNFCDGTADCTGSTYTANEYQHNTSGTPDTPIRNAEIYVRDDNQNVVGMGNTDDNGRYKLKWRALRGTGHDTPSSPKLWVEIWARHKDGRFYVADVNGGISWGQLGPVLAQSGTTSNSWQTISFFFSAPNYYFNTYWALEKMWRETLSPAGAAFVNVTNVEVRGFPDLANPIPGFIPGDSSEQPIALSSASLKRIRLARNFNVAGASPQSAAMHEMGHIVAYQMKPWSSQGLNYDWSDPSVPDTMDAWKLESPEWGRTAFEEAFATHLANITLWRPNAVLPTSCEHTAGSCYGSGGSVEDRRNVELTLYPYATNHCPSFGDRTMVNEQRFLWDIYDDHNDADGDDYSAAAAGEYVRHITLFAFYKPGTDAFELNEPYADQLDDRFDQGLDTGYPTSGAFDQEVRASVSYENNYRQIVGRDLDLLRISNCSVK